MLTKAGIEHIEPLVGSSHEDQRFQSLLRTISERGQQRIRFCPNGHEVDSGKPKRFECGECGYEGPRAVTFNEKTRFRIENGALLHYSVGAVVLCRFDREEEDRVVLLRRVPHPEGAFTIPSGHWDAGEDVLKAAEREVEEETGLTLLVDWELVFKEEKMEEECRSGSNLHLWNFYRCYAKPEAADLRLRGDEHGTRTGEADMIGWIPVSQVAAGLFWLTRPAGHFLGKILETRIRHVLPR